MKNRSNKSNKTRFIARVLLLILLLTSALSFAGCGITLRGYDCFRLMETDGIHVRPAAILVKAKTNIYEVEDLTLDLVIGLHRTSLFGKTDGVPKNQYAYGSYDMGFAIYISDGEFVNDFPSSVDDLKSIENHYFVDEITEEEAFTKQYGYNKFGYNHQRKISIPSKFLSKEKGSFTIKLANYYNFGEDNQSKYYRSKFDFVMDDSVYVIVLEYEKSEDGRVIITNFHDKRTGGYYK